MDIVVLNKLVFDGNEKDFYSFDVLVECPRCSQKITFLGDDMFPFSELDTNSLPKYFTKQLNLKRKSGEHVFENNKGLEVFVIECECESCGVNHIFFAGVGEIQPDRFNIFLEGVLSK